MFSDMYEGFQVARTSFMDPSTPRGPWKAPGRVWTWRKSLKTSELLQRPLWRHGLYTFKAAQYHFMANPWMQGATRMLSATDDSFKVLSARQKARFDAHDAGH